MDSFNELADKKGLLATRQLGSLLRLFFNISKLRETDHRYPCVTADNIMKSIIIIVLIDFV